MLDFIIQYWVGVGFGLIVSFGGYSAKKINKKLSEQDSLKLGVQALLRDRIIQAYTYCDEQGYCPIHIRDNIEHMAKEYYNLGGNGMIHQLMDKLADLPTSNPKDE